MCSRQTGVNKLRWKTSSRTFPKRVALFPSHFQGSNEQGLITPAKLILFGERTGTYKSGTSNVYSTSMEMKGCFIHLIPFKGLSTLLLALCLESMDLRGFPP